MTDSIDVGMDFEFNEDAPQQDSSNGIDPRRLTEADQQLGKHTTLGVDIGDGYMELELGNVDNVAPQPTVDPNTVEPFASEEELAAAQDKRTEDGRYLTEVNPEYRALVRARMAASMGRVDTWSTGFDPKAAERRKAQKDAARRAKALKSTDAVKIGASAADDTAQAEPFESEAEMAHAMNDPRWDTKPSYRRQIEARLAVTDFTQLVP